MDVAILASLIVHIKEITNIVFLETDKNLLSYCWGGGELPPSLVLATKLLII